MQHDLHHGLLTMAGRWVAWVASVALLAGVSVRVQTPEEDLTRAIDRLGDFDHQVRVEASQFVRRADPATAVPALLEAVRFHTDSYVQFRAIVLIYGLNPPETRRIFEEALDARNDRLRAAAYEYFEYFPSPFVVPKLAAAMDAEVSEFVRPYLVRALVANTMDTSLPSSEMLRARLVADIDRGEGYFRGAVIEALGDHAADYALDPLIRIAGEEGTLQDDALLALGKIGDDRAVAAMARLQDDASETLQPVVSATACLLEIDCEGHLEYIANALRYGAEIAEGDRQRLVRSAASGLAALAMRGHMGALDTLFEVGIAYEEPARAPIALALGTVALRQPDQVRMALEGRAMPDDELLLLRDAFDMLDEDLAEERFYSRMRRSYWDAPEGSSSRAFAETALRVLEF